MSIQSAVGHSDYVAEPFEAGQEIAQMVLSKLSLKAHSVGILFCNIDFNFQELIKGIKSEFDVPIIGCTTASEGNNDCNFEDAASLIVITSDDTRIGTGMGTDLSKDASEAVNQATRQAMAGLNGEKPRLALTFPDITMKPISANLMLAQLVSILGPDVPIAGGLPGDSLRFKTPFQFHDGQVLTDAFPIVLFSGAIDPTIITRSGWIPVGEPARVSKAIGNVVHEIDGRPAVEYLKRYIPESLDDPQMLAIYPLAILDDSLGNDRSRYFVIRSAFS
ncbi:MAG: FIST signal transduction protein [Steroidobacteraceae bacterium]